MRGGVFVLVAFVAAGSAALAYSALRPPAVANVAQASPVREVSKPAPPTSRIFLTRQQVNDALANGTIDRPITSLLSVKRPLYFGDYSWDDRGVPADPTWV